ncbi:amino acid synthesis family protein [Salinigranum salinum]|uniref:amino acid synthesis family protein n=1 Tax=Salinigranum salinum TaxID=1364937 RepID=UPI0012604345|nr:amino acid synthesis family protein [Salinigranum salinum]
MADSTPEVRKRVLRTETTLRDGERELAEPVTKAAAVAVLTNPFAGTWQDDLERLTDWGATLGETLTRAAVDALGGAELVESYGKGGIVGSAGEVEHVAAMLHPELGGPMRAAVGGGEAIIPSAKKHGGQGTSLDVPTHYKDEAYVRSHYDAMEVRVHDAPRDDELLLAVVVTDGGRFHPRIGGLTKGEASERQRDDR